MKTKEELADEYVSNHEDPEIRRMYGHYCKMFIAGFETAQNQVQILPIDSVSSSWLDHHVLNEDSEIDGVIIKHHASPETYGGVSIKTAVGNFAVVKEDQERSAKNIGFTVRVKPHKEFYGTVKILQYHDR